MRISDWSSDVCSSDLGKTRRKVIGRYGLMTAEQGRRAARVLLGEVAKGTDPVEEAEQQRGHTIDEICDWYLERAEAGKIIGRKIGRASCRERGCQYG